MFHARVIHQELLLKFWGFSVIDQNAQLWRTRVTFDLNRTHFDA